MERCKFNIGKFDQLGTSTELGIYTCLATTSSTSVYNKVELQQSPALKLN